MPSKSEAQRKFMSIAAHDPEFAKRNKIPQSVAEEFHQADAGKSYGAGMHKGVAHRKKLAKALRGY